MGWERRRDMRDMMGDGLVVAAWEVCVVAVVAVVVVQLATRLGQASGCQVEILKRLTTFRASGAKLFFFFWHFKV